MFVQLNLRNKILLLVSTIMLVFLSTLMIAQYMYISRIQEQQFNAWCKIQAKLLVQNIGQAMWDMNNSYVMTAADNVLKQSNIIRVIITDAGNNVVVDRVDSDFASEIDRGEGLEISEPIDHIDNFNRQNLGVAKLVFSRGGVKTEQNNLMITFLIADFIAMIIYLLGFYYFSKQFFQPVSDITKTMLSLSHGEIGIDIPYLDKKDEIGDMARAIQTFKKTAVSVDNLIHEIHEREIVQAELEVKTELAKSANKAKSIFLANMSHEIRTPLNGVISTAELLIEDQLSPRQRKYVEIIQGSGKLLLTLLNDLLDLSKIEAHKLELHNDVFDVLHSLQVVTSLFASGAEQKGVTLKLDIDENLPRWVVGDEHRFRQVLSNLVGNAVKYTAKGTINVIAQTKANKDTHDIYIEVVDTGIGIPQQALETLFDRFSQAHKSSAINGTGLGLSICQSLIDLMGGFIGVQSREGLGSTFWFVLPLREADPPAAELQELEVSKKIANIGCQVLLVEDVEVNRIVIKDMLEMIGCNVDTAVDGQCALDMYAQQPYDIVFMDCNMPVMDGFEATIKLRELYGEGFPIIAVSAHVSSEDIQHCFDVGMNGYVYKPVSKKSLSDTILKWVKLEDIDIKNQEKELPITVDNHSDSILFNAQILVDWYRRNPQLTTKFIELTLKDANRLCKDLLDSIEKNDFVMIKETAHALKSVAAQIGGSHLSEICLSLEKAAQGKSEKDIHQCADLFKTSFADFVKEIDFFRVQHQV